MRYELTDCGAAIKPFLPNKPRGVPRVNDRRNISIRRTDAVGSQAAVTARLRNVRTTSRSGAKEDIAGCRRCAIS